MNKKNITFSSNEFVLKGTLHLPTTVRPPVVIGSHGLFSSSSSPKQVALAKQCNACGIAFFRFDHRGCGQSDGIFKDVTSLEARCNDLISAIKLIQKRKDTGRIGLFGSSMGGAVCLSVFAESDVYSIVTCAAPVRSNSIIKKLGKSEDSDLMNPPFYKRYLESDISDKLSHVHHILIFHGDSDDLVPLLNAKEINEKAGDPKKLIIQKGGDHRMSNKKHQETFVRESALWFKSCFDGAI
ncbi:MAG: alpha/beta fold hydrolase [Deltaproteobacteria bacterium]|nr:alpha/beta fold hydrolase [Deltaproteobacteria bacterium]MBW2620648.1 alpha/beta fold hydrolase [Deltaproteobacteria bacterium]